MDREKVMKKMLEAFASSVTRTAWETRDATDAMRAALAVAEEAIRAECARIAREKVRGLVNCMPAGLADAVADEIADMIRSPDSALHANERAGGSDRG